MKLLFSLIGIAGIVGGIGMIIYISFNGLGGSEPIMTGGGQQENSGELAIEDAEVTVPVLMYHDFSYEVENSLTVHPDDLDEQMRALKEAGYTTITDQDLIDYKNGDEDALPEKPLLITIDDGYISNYELAFPIFKEHEMKASIYIIVERRDEGYENHFTWDQAREMTESGFINIQNHTYNSHDYVETESGDEAPLMVAQQPGESEEDYLERIREDLALAIERIEEEIDIEVNAFAFPYGRYNEDVLEVSRDLGMEMFYTVREEMNTEENINEGIMHRFNVPGGMSGEELVEMLEENS